MKRVLVIGIGSLVMMDDGIGSRVVNAIKSSLAEGDIPSFIAETDFQCCFDVIKADDFVIIIDAMVQGTKPGNIDIMPLSDALKSRRKLRMQHEFSLFDLIELYMPRIRGYFIGIEVSEIDFGFDLSIPLKECFEQICTEVLNAVLSIKEQAVGHNTHLLEKAHHHRIIVY